MEDSSSRDTQQFGPYPDKIYFLSGIGSGKRSNFINFKVKYRHNPDGFYIRWDFRFLALIPFSFPYICLSFPSFCLFLSAAPSLCHSISLPHQPLPHFCRSSTSLQASPLRYLSIPLLFF